MVYHLLRCDATGRHLDVGLGGELSARPHAGDGCMWTLRGDARAPSVVHSALGGVELLAEPAAPARPSCSEEGASFMLRGADGHPLAEDGRQCGPGTAPAVFTAVTGPARLPSDYLAELRKNGYTVLESVLHPDAISQLKAEFARVRAAKFADESSHDGHFWMMNFLAETPLICRVACHPVALWLMQQYLGVKALHFFHQPIVNTLKPARKMLGRALPGGWHSDYPYRRGRFIGDAYPPGDVMKLGVQYNVCVDEFRADNAATQLIPGSHLEGREPPEALNEGGTVMGAGLHSEAVQVTAPAGAAIIYDSRTWHRACYELNASGSDRVAILHAVGPAWIAPMLDKTCEAEAYLTSRVPAMLDARTARDIERMCCAELRQRQRPHPAARL